MAATRRSEDIDWSPERVYAPLAHNGYRSWLPTNSFIDAPLSKHVFEADSLALAGRQTYTDERYPSFLQLVRAGKPQGVIKVPTKEGGHETVRACVIDGCNFVCTSKAEYERHIRCLHVDPVSADVAGCHGSVHDPGAVLFSLDGAEPHLPPAKKLKIGESLPDDVAAEFDEDGADDDGGPQHEDVADEEPEGDGGEGVGVGVADDSCKGVAEIGEQRWCITRSRAPAKCHGCGEKVDGYDFRVAPPSETRKKHGWWKNRHLRFGCLSSIG